MNIVLNNGTVLCEICYEEEHGDGRGIDLPDYMRMGDTPLRCGTCGVSGDARERAADLLNDAWAALRHLPMSTNAQSPITGNPVDLAAVLDEILDIASAIRNKEF